MQRTPNTSHVLIAANHIPPSNLLILRPTILQQQLCLLYDLARLQVPHADSLCVAVNVVCLQDRVLVWSWGDPELSGWVAGCQGWEGGLGKEFIHATG